jgi:predicted lipid-binding transport protein (Tim44 family)
MWLYPFAGVLVVFAIFGSIFGGGIFTIILVPLAVIGFFSALAYALIAGAASRTAGGSADPAQSARGPATRVSQTPSPPTPSSPGELVDARRGQQ